MPVIRMTAFQGRIPRLKPRLLPENYAQAAVNTRLEDGAVAPLRAPEPAFTLPGVARTFVRHAGEWIGWNGVVEAVPGPVAADRLYITGDGAPKLRVAGVTYPLALPPPASKPTLATGGALNQDISEEIIYAYTWVTEFDEESAPSPASNRIEWSENQSVTVSGFSSPPAGRGVNRIRLYRSQTSTLGVTDFYYVAEFASTEVNYVHNIGGDPLAEVLPTADFNPPTPDMEGIISLPNGIMAAFDGKRILFSEPFIPHSWPIKYRITLDYPIIALAAFGSTLAVMTTGMPYIVQGTHPDNMVSERVEQNLPCVSKRGVVDLGYAAAYPSNDGLVLISNQGGRIVTENLFTREQWRALDPSTFVAGHHQRRYVFSRQVSAGVREMGVIDITGQQPFYMTSDVQAVGMWHDLATSDLFFLEGAEPSAEIRRWDAGEHMIQTWRSRVHHLPAPMNFGAVMIEGDPTLEADFCTARVYADDRLIAVTDVINEPDRLPGDFLAYRWEVEIEGDVPVTAISLAGSPSELVGG